MAGVWVFDDYGVSPDGANQLLLTASGLAYASDIQPALRNLGGSYGTAFETMLYFVQQVLRLDDSRSILLSRHLLTHAFFIAGGFCCYLLVHRMFNRRLLALFGLLLFVLHPRLYAHSFFNSKDIPVLVMFMMALLLSHRAFKKKGLRDFVLLGAGVGILINLSIMGWTLFAAILIMRLCDLLYAARQEPSESTSHEERNRVLLTSGIFALASAAVLFATSPHLRNTLFGADANTAIADAAQPADAAFDPLGAYQLFRGELFRPADLPWDYLPVWIAITTPLVALLLGIIGVAAVLYGGFRRRGDILRNTELRFGLLLLICFAAPIAAVIVLNVPLQDGWRLMYFLYAPWCLLAVRGLQLLIAMTGKLPRLLMPSRVAVFALAGFGVAMSAAAIIQLHPYQHVYFNFLVDRNTPEHLRTQYDMDYSGLSSREGLEYLVDRFPSSPIYVEGTQGLYTEDGQDYSKNIGPFTPSEHGPFSTLERMRRSFEEQNLGSAERNLMIFSEKDRQRVELLPIGGGADYHITSHREHASTGWLHEVLAPAVYTRKVYNNTILTVAALDLSLADESEADAWRDVYSETLSGPPTFHSAFDGYLQDDRLYYVKEGCDASDTEARFFLHITPTNMDDLPDDRKQIVFNNSDFDFRSNGMKIDGHCVAYATLPSYEIFRIRTGQFTEADGELWSETITLRERPLVGGDPLKLAQAYTAASSGQPIEMSAIDDSAFDVYLYEDKLYYLKEQCTSSDFDARFFLHVFPWDINMLPEERKQFGFDNLDFSWDQYGAALDDRCWIEYEIPAYRFRELTTGQYTEEGTVWAGQFKSKYGATLSDTPTFRRNSDLYPSNCDFYPEDRGACPEDREANFDLYLRDRKLYYIEENCDLSDIESRFFLHIHPSDIDDLPVNRKHHGFDNLDFNFRAYGMQPNGIRTDGRCIAVVTLPSYDIINIRTGQFVLELEQDQLEYKSLWKHTFTLEETSLPGFGQPGRQQVHILCQSRVCRLRPAIADSSELGEDYIAALSGQRIQIFASNSSVFEVFLYEDSLYYLKQQCTSSDIDADFFLHVTPWDISALPEDRRKYSFESLDFSWDRYGVRLKDRCWIKRELPAYRIKGITTGQFNEEGRIWAGRFNLQ